MRLPRRAAGVVARGPAPPEVRQGLARIARQRGLTLLIGADGRAALALRAGLHLPDREGGVAGLLPFLAARRGGPRWAVLTLAVHGRRGIARARRLRPALVFLSPAFPTASHPGAPALGPLRWAALARRLPCPAVALGGVAPATAGRLPVRLAAGLAAIGALSSAP
jgi:thiamine-phosphate pyrophosphorylase